MRLSVLACVSFLASWSAIAGALELEGPSAQLQSNGDVLIENTGLSFASRLTVVMLNTNADYRVACQVFYCDENMSLDDDEINLKDRYINQALAMFLFNVCEDLSPEELVDDYRLGVMGSYLEDFRQYVNEDLADLGIEIVAVAMRAVGEFGQCVSDEGRLHQM